MESERKHAVGSREGSDPKILENIEFPQGLTEKDKELIVAECIHQNATTPEQILGFAEAYKKAKEFAANPKTLSRLTVEDFREFVESLAALIESEEARSYRQIPVSFPDGSLALDWKELPRQMNIFYEAFVEGRLSPEEAYRIYEQNHPYRDGNGRTGDLIWKIAMTRETGEWPQELPPDVFRKDIEIGNP